MKNLYLLVALVSINIYAADWQLYGTDTSGAKYYIDMENSVLSNDIWTKTEYNSNQKINNIIFNSSISKYSVSCKKKKIISLSSVYYNNGEVVLSNDTPSGVNDIVPDSVGETMLKKACSLPTSLANNESYIDMAHNPISTSSSISQKTAKQCNQSYDDLAYFIKILNICSAEYNINMKMAAQNILSGCPIDTNRLNKSTQKVTNSINKLIKQKGIQLFCQEEMNYFNIVTNKYGITYDEI